MMMIIRRGKRRMGRYYLMIFWGLLIPCLLMFGKEVVNEWLGSSHDDVPFAMQSPPRPTSSLILHQPVIFRPDSLISGWDLSLPLNPGSVMYFPSRFGHSGSHMDTVSSYAYRDLISQDAADEGSRTGMKGSGILNIINPSSSGAGNKNTAGMQPTTSKPKDLQMIEHGSSNVPSQYNMASCSRQMTIFYAGQAHVFDDVHPNKEWQQGQHQKMQTSTTLNRRSFRSGKMITERGDMSLQQVRIKSILALFNIHRPLSKAESDVCASGIHEKYGSKDNIKNMQMSTTLNRRSFRSGKMITERGDMSLQQVRIKSILALFNIHRPLSKAESDVGASGIHEKCIKETLLEPPVLLHACCPAPPRRSLSDPPSVPIPPESCGGSTIYEIWRI